MSGEGGTRTDVLRHKVGTCPACRDYLWADITVVSRLGKPSMDTEGKTAVRASIRPTAASVVHSCDSRDEEPTP